MLQNRQQIGEVVVGGVGNNKNIFKGVDEALLKCFSDFLGVAIMVLDLHERAILLSSSVHKEFSGMANKIDELMSGEQAISFSSDMLKSEEATSNSRNKALHSLFNIEKELDSQSAVLEALLE